MLIERLAVIGIGLIGGSLARAIKASRLAGRVVGYDANPAELAEALHLGVIDEPSEQISQAVQNADVVAIAVPLGAMEAVLRAVANSLSSDAVVTDVGSAKLDVVAHARAELGSAFDRFVPGHPIAGREQNGVGASRADLFQQHRVILTPVPETSASAINLVRELWEGTGAQIELMDPQRHDDILAATSHLPHVLAYALVYSLSRLDESGAIFRFAAGGFADFTRIASSRPEVWRDILFSNAQPVLEMLRLFDRDLGEVIQAIERRDDEAMLNILRQAKQARDRFAASRAVTEQDKAGKEGKAS